MQSWYFAYGSNLSLEQMIARTGHRDSQDWPPRRARLANFRLLFQSLTPQAPAFANIVAPGPGVVGVVYRCSPVVLRKLDDFEQGYDRRTIQVHDDEGYVLAAQVYVISPANVAGVGRPAADYLQRIVDGARHHRLPEDYIRGILAIAATPNS